MSKETAQQGEKDLGRTMNGTGEVREAEPRSGSCRVAFGAGSQVQAAAWAEENNPDRTSAAPQAAVHGSADHQVQPRQGANR